MEEWAPMGEPFSWCALVHSLWFSLSSRRVTRAWGLLADAPPRPRSAGVLTRSMQNHPRRLCSPPSVTVPTRYG